MPQVLNQFSNYTGELEEKEKEMIIEAGRTYVELNSASFTTTRCVSLQTLVDAELLNEKFILFNEFYLILFLIIVMIINQLIMYMEIQI